MWDELRTDEYGGMLAETVTMTGNNGDLINAYLSRPLGKGPFPGIVLIHHMPGWDEFHRETSRRFSEHGYAVICPNLYCRLGHGTPREIGEKVLSAGGIPEDGILGDCEGAMKYLRSLPYSNGKVGVIGVCSGGRHSFLAACQIKGFNAAVECWGGPPIDLEAIRSHQPAAPIDDTSNSSNLGCPLLGIFGNDDQAPSPEMVNRHEEELKKYGKNYEFHRYDGAGHGIWYYTAPSYRPQQAMDSWQKAFEFFGKYLRT
jgi:carboxymethylenebutenolidase